MNIVTQSKRMFRQFFPSRPHFATRDLIVGSNVVFGEDVVFNCKRVRIGDGVIFQDHIRIDADIFEVGDYGTFYSGFFVSGPGELRIGHNCHVGRSVIIDAMGGTNIGNNFGVGAGSQLWTHMMFGDVMAGCKFHTVQPLHIGDDVWLSAHTLVSPVSIGDRSLVTMGSKVTKSIPHDSIFDGNPAEDITEKVGSQFRVTSLVRRIAYLNVRLKEYDTRYPEDRVLDRTLVVGGGETASDQYPDDRIVFDVIRRTYAKRRLPMENRLIRFLLPDAKFIPEGDAP